jgi:triosephosphate isomerase (TIM)
MNKKLVVGNWKMNLTVFESTILIEKLKKELKGIKSTEVVVCPTFLDIYAASKELTAGDISVGAQNLFFEEAGAYTGEISAVQLQNFAKYVIIGHSERRANFGETDKMVAKKAAIAYAHSIIPIICVGETYHEKGDGLSKVVVMSQLETALSHLTASEVAETVVAYEPVWAISTSGGIACKPGDATAMAKNIRALVSALYGKEASEKVRVLFGGSVNPDNAEDYSKAEGIDGVLVGAASLDHEKFSAVAKIFDKKAVSKVPKKAVK